RMLDVPRDIPETEIATKKPQKKEKVYDDVSIADLGGESIMEEDPSVKQLLADQMQIIPMAPGAPGQPDAAVSASSEAAQPPAVLQANTYTGPMVPDFRGKSMRDALEAASSRGIQVTVEGSGFARAQLPLPNTPLHQGEKIRIVFTR